MEANQISQPVDTHQRKQAIPEEVKRIVRDASQHPTYPRKCLSCGAFESLDGSVPCGH
ncbi:hypothetical protein BLA18112_03328 [Burkholderia lata]|uniref:Uncharacterized protein n=1 Tax=Burkholderia lata (strain ATCC 17760 / DSM 23089 / LMG 22485 / NCIMB 9086 / R18194 / 383) TaxID=482957 RepID=A0A6P2VJU4_BURL3|nr:hypothetical protein [Burkholderia lata]VWC91126.1 hypothetical protein BLA18112_03328 [Burkholderia lata]